MSVLTDIWIFKLHILHQKEIKLQPLNQNYLFRVITNNFGKPTFVLPASRKNKKRRRFFSFYPDLLASGIDAFSFDWGHENLYAFLPFKLISRILQKIENEKTEGILTVPIFFNQSRFTRVFTLLIEKSIWLPRWYISSAFSYRRKTIPTLSKTKLMAWNVSGMSFKSRKFKIKFYDKSILDLNNSFFLY